MVNKILEITQATHNFSIRKLTPRAKTLVNEFCKRYIQKGMIRNADGSFYLSPVKVFATARADREEYRFHINQLQEFLEYLKDHYVTEDLFRLIHASVPAGRKIIAPVKPQWVARERQIPVIEYLLANTASRSRFVDAPTGSGKTFMTMQALSVFAKRTVILIKPMYIEKWHEDLTKTYDIDPKDIMVVRGGAHLKGLISLALENKLEASFILISNKTFQYWISQYELYGDDIEALGYETTPGDFFKTVGAGVRLIDEVHQDFHLNFKIDLYTNVERSISLSATLLNNDQFIEKMYRTAYPLNTRYVMPMPDGHISSFGIFYNFGNIDKIRTREFGSNNYSHNAVEKSIMRNHETVRKYFGLIDYTIAFGFTECKRPKKKLLIFASTIEMCTLLTNYLSMRYKQYNVKRYVSGDPYSDLMESDICVSTLGSAGTAVDIPNLTTVILTVAVDSIQSNIQSLGRLRDLNDGSEVQFYYFACTDIPKHMEYSKRKEEMLNKRAKSYRQLWTRYTV